MFVVVDDDAEAWARFPDHHLWFNKLWLAEMLGYTCGPAGTSVPVSGQYIVRPTYNLSGMGVGARKCLLEVDDYRSVPPGFFWCEWFDGDHISSTFVRVGDGWEVRSSWRGVRSGASLSRFAYWERCRESPDLHPFIASLTDVPVINVEFIGGRPIEVHLRDSPDPQGWGRIVPVWADELDDGGKWVDGVDRPGTFVASFDDADGFLEVPRIGFMITDE